jgi:hypothetical protein
VSACLPQRLEVRAKGSRALTADIRDATSAGRARRRRDRRASIGSGRPDHFTAGGQSRAIGQAAGQSIAHDTEEPATTRELMRSSSAAGIEWEFGAHKWLSFRQPLGLCGNAVGSSAAQGSSMRSRRSERDGDEPGRVGRQNSQHLRLCFARHRANESSSPRYRLLLLESLREDDRANIRAASAASRRQTACSRFAWNPTKPAQGHRALQRSLGQSRRG